MKDGTTSQNALQPTQSQVIVRSTSSNKEMLLIWVQRRLKNYKNVEVANFSTSWNDGMAFCALIHYYYPEAFDFDQLEPKNRRHNFTLAFEAAEKFADIYPLLEVDDMVRMKKPDWKCVFTYVQSFYHRFKDDVPPTATGEAGSERNPEDKPAESFGCSNPKGFERTLSQEQQKSLLSKYLIEDDADDKGRSTTTRKGSNFLGSASRLFAGAAGIVGQGSQQKKKPPQSMGVNFLCSNVNKIALNVGQPKDSEANPDDPANASKIAKL